MKILILDDDQDLAASLADALRFEGHDVLLSQTVEDAEATAKTEAELNVAVLDVNVAADNSIRLVRALKRGRPEIRVISMTGGGRVRADLGMPLATAHGADAALLKPFSINEFLAAVTGDEAAVRDPAAR